MKNIFILSFFLFVALNACNKKKVTETDVQTHESEKYQTLTGKIISKSWSKTGQSYCAQGSGYFVLEYAGSETILETAPELSKKLEDFKDKDVTITGYKRSKLIKIDPNDGGQHPISYNPQTRKNEVTDYSCEVFVVTNIE